MHLILPFREVLELATAERPLPAPIEGVSCEGDTVFVTLGAESLLSGLLPSALRAAAPKVQLELRFRTFVAGVATFDLRTNVLALPVHRLLNRITPAITLPAGVRIDRGSDAPRLTVDVQRFVDERFSGLTLDELYLFGGEVVVVATLRDFRTRARGAQP